ncbi:MAG: dipeptidase [Steroidobacteraceae bacterium]
MNGPRWNRRALLAGIAGAVAVASAPRSLRASASEAGAAAVPPVFDALGEIRTVYTPELLDQVLASGTRAIAVTLTDPKAAVDEAFDLLLRDISLYNRYLKSLPDHFILARSVTDIDRAARERKLAVFYNIQDSNPVGRDLDRVALLKALGLTSIQLTYNTTNYSGSGCFVDPDPGITTFGRELVERLAAERVLLDLSHAGMRTMAEAIAASPRPVIVSHTACKALRNHRRNTTDANMRAVAARGGVVGITQIRTFLTDAKRDNLEVYFGHIAHAVQVAGIEHVGIGSDRDHRVIPDTEEELKILLAEEGSQVQPADWPLYLETLNGPRRGEVVRDGLRSHGFVASDIDRIMGGNVYRLYREIEGKA